VPVVLEAKGASRPPIARRAHRRGLASICRCQGNGPYALSNSQSLESDAGRPYAAWSGSSSRRGLIKASGRAISRIHWGRLGLRRQALPPFSSSELDPALVQAPPTGPQPRGPPPGSGIPLTLMPKQCVLSRVNSKSIVVLHPPKRHTRGWEPTLLIRLGHIVSLPFQSNVPSRAPSLARVFLHVLASAEACFLAAPLSGLLAGEEVPWAKTGSASVWPRLSIPHQDLARRLVQIMSGANTDVMLTPFGSVRPHHDPQVTRGDT